MSRHVRLQQYMHLNTVQKLYYEDMAVALKIIWFISSQSQSKRLTEKDFVIVY